MKVKVTAQNLRASVATAITFLPYLITPKFEHSDSTTLSIQKLKVFDIFNSNNKSRKAAKNSEKENIVDIIHARN